MWILLVLIIAGFILLIPFLSLLLPLLFLFFTVMIFIGRPSIRVYTKTFPSESWNATPLPSSKSPLDPKDPSVIDVEFQERES